MSRYTNKFVEFLAGYNVVCVKSQSDLDTLIKMVNNIGLDLHCSVNTYEYWLHLAEINHKKVTNGELYFEYRAAKGFSFDTNLDMCVEYYGEDPFTIADFEEALGWNSKKY